MDLFTRLSRNLTALQPVISCGTMSGRLGGQIDYVGPQVRLRHQVLIVSPLAISDHHVFMMEGPMKSLAFWLVTGATLGGALAFTPPASGQADKQAGPIFVTKMPLGYRDWKLISVAHEEGNLNSFAAVLGNDVAIKAYREAKLSFPDGAIIAALHWNHVSSEDNNRVFGRSQSFVAGPSTNVQFMVKDAKKYATTGGWGFGHFNKDGTPGAEALLTTCSPCHAKASRDFVFTQYAPSY
jgi:hypothetical protein